MNFPRVIYALRHESTGKIYVGSTANLHQRILKHANDLRRGIHQVPDFQADYDQHKNKELTVTVLDTATNWEEHFREYEWMDRYQTNDRKRGYNYMDPHFRRKPRA